MSSRTFRAALTVAVMAYAIAATPALAHVQVVKTSPKTGATAKRTTASATVTFTGPIRRGTLRVTGPGGKRASVGNGARDPRNINRLLAELRTGLKAGSYKGSWTIVAADGHHEQGSFKFRLK